ncbi:MAG: UDP-N-acetylglucosamine 2-epimerase (non-hydrolyzing) [Candidatus Omnitrophota bacterium]|nr:UDP-N-acetylglucosamine 2-epimerase (non-hydrolyzing) [Candidatus Omnitrophota bacterium]
MFHIFTVIGARPQFVKAAVVSLAIKRLGRGIIKESIIHTGQHYDYSMSGIFFKELNIPRPIDNLNVGSFSHGKQTGIMLERLERVFIRDHPDMVLVYGDTNSTLAATLAAAKLHIPVAHVEAGMRSFNKLMPEELNRVAVDHMSDILFCSSDASVKNLRREGIPDKNNGKCCVVLNVGDVMVDALKFFYSYAEKRSKILAKLNLKPRNYYLVTVHRAENTDSLEKLKVIFKSLNIIAEKGSCVVIPMHPRTLSALKRLGMKNFSKNMRIIGPVSYFDMLLLEKNAAGIFTDSGGVQKEAYIFRVPAITLRTETEWVETVKSGWNTLVPINEKAIMLAFDKMARFKRDSLRVTSNIYGDGKASGRIAGFFQKYFITTVKIKPGLG